MTKGVVMDESTAEFLRVMNERNAAIAARQAREEAQTPKPDELRLQRERERREKWDQLRARTHGGSRPVRTRRLYGYTDLS
jgi:hypothetical protein